MYKYACFFQDCKDFKSEICQDSIAYDKYTMISFSDLEKITINI